MQSPEGSIYTVQELQRFIPAQALGGKHWIVGEKSFELLDGTPIDEDENGELVVHPDGPTLTPIAQEG